LRAASAACARRVRAEVAQKAIAQQETLTIHRLRILSAAFFVLGG
jgi:hypothetical protein